MLAYVRIFILTVGIIILLFDTTQELPDVTEDLQEIINTGGTNINVFKERGRNRRLKHSVNGEWPWAISVGYNESNEWVHECDGVLVTGNHVITSASCLKDYEWMSGMEIKTLSAKAGADYVKFVEEDTQEISVMDYKLHPEFYEFSNYKDIAVIILSSEFQFTDFVLPAYLPSIEEATNSTKSKETDVTLAICGWSGTHASDRGTKLESDVITSIRDNYCRRVYKGEGLNGTLITDDIVCAVNVLGLHGTCAGGKGSGIFRLNHAKRRFVLTGILSSDTENLSFRKYRKDCGNSSYPNVFVRIASRSVISFLYNVIYNIEVDSVVSVPPPQEPIQDDNRDEECGINNVLDEVLNMDMNMSDGMNVMNGRWPWLVPLFKNDYWDGNDKFFCGATILSNTTLLTAAHCVDRVKEKDNLKVRAGWLQESDNLLVQEIKISKSDVMIHPSYKRNRYFDLAIIHLQSPLNFTQRVSQVCLLSKEDAARISQDDEVSLSLSVSGWGHNKYWLTGKTLKQNIASIFSKDFCDRSHQDFHGRKKNLVPNGFTEDVLCAGDPVGQSGTCRGDSGGGAVHFDQKRQRYVLRAVVSGSKLGVCGTSYAPNIYVRMANPDIMRWIYAQLDCSIICDQRGSISGACSAKGECQCKKNVEGRICDRCKAGAIQLSEMNPHGCSPCFCSGVTDECTDGELFWSTLRISYKNHGISLVDEGRSVVKQPEELTFMRPSYELSYRVAFGDNTTYYWALPQQFTGNKVTAYGGNLTITQRYEPSDWGAEEPIEVDIIIVSKGFTLVYNKVGWPSTATSPPQASPVCSSSSAAVTSSTDSEYSKVYRVPMSKDGWIVESTGEPATREVFLKTIINIEAILIRATLDKHMEETVLKGVVMDIAVPDPTGGPPAQGIEQCQCPKGYKGFSCEECAKGFYRDHYSRCIECPCNNNEQSCSLGDNGKVQCVCKEGYTGNFCKYQAINCSFSNWTRWTRCSVSCGGGLQKRVRWITQEALRGGTECDGESMQEQKCAQDNCSVRFIPVDCSFSNWSTWTTCSVTCGGGQQHRVRWITQEALHGGADCDGESIQEQQCAQDNCPVDCSLSNWSTWTDCSVTCGGGHQNRERWITQEALQGGTDCDEERSQEQQCAQDNCPVDCSLSNWSTWTDCSVTCGGGHQNRERWITQEAVHGGIECDGERSQEQRCAQDNCPLGPVYLLAGGLGAKRDISVYHPTVDNVACSSLPTLNNKWYRHSVFYNLDTVYLCGGLETASTCISHSKGMEGWNTHTLSTPRMYHSALVLQGRVFFVGGRDSGGNYLGTESTPIPLEDPIVLRDEPKLDYKGYYPCTAIIDQDTLVVTGGSYYGSSTRVATYNVETSTYTQLPSLKQGRYGHGCGVLVTGGSKWIIVAGGAGNAKQSTEMLQLGIGNAPVGDWTPIGILKVARQGHTMAVTQRGVMVMGGMDASWNEISSVELLDWDSKTWSIVHPSLNKPRSSFGGAVKIPASMFDCVV